MVYKAQNPKLPNHVRFGLLETTREFAHQALSASDEKGEVQTKHAEFVCKLAEDMEPRLVGPEAVRTLDLLESEIGNVRAALSHSKAADDPETGLRIAAALRKFWISRGFSREGRVWLAEMLALQRRQEDCIAARAFVAAGFLAQQQGEEGQALEHLNRALRIYENLAHKRGVAEALGFLGCLYSRYGRLPESQQMLSRAVVLSREIDDSWQTGNFLIGLAANTHWLGDEEKAFALYSESAQLLAACWDKRALSLALNALGLMEAQRGELTSGKLKLRDSLAMAAEVGADQAVMVTLESLAEVGFIQRDFRRAARLIAAADAGRTLTGVSMSSGGRIELEHLKSLVRSNLTVEQYEAAWKEGQAMTIEDAVEYALEDDTESVLLSTGPPSAELPLVLSAAKS